MNSPESAWVQDHATNDTLRCTTLSNEYYGALPQMWIVDTIRTVWRRGQSVLCSLGKCVAPTLRLRGRLRGKRQFGRTDGRTGRSPTCSPQPSLPLRPSATKNTRLGQPGGPAGESAFPVTGDSGGRAEISRRRCAGHRPVR